MIKLRGMVVTGVWSVFSENAAKNTGKRKQGEEEKLLLYDKRIISYLLSYV